jgi:lipid II:glycine glycyltransferase (peptidoglycan interpeptide bridge formation enzyme)
MTETKKIAYTSLVLHSTLERKYAAQALIRLANLNWPDRYRRNGRCDSAISVEYRNFRRHLNRSGLLAAQAEKLL